MTTASTINEYRRVSEPSDIASSSRRTSRRNPLKHQRQSLQRLRGTEAGL